MKIRALDHGDLPKVAEIILAAMNNDRLWTAFVPRKSAHDTAFTQEMIDLLKARADPAKKDWDVQVVDIGREDAPEVVAVAVWDVSSTREGSGSKESDLSEPDVSDTRIRDYLSLASICREEYFDTYQKPRFLQLLATHPNHKTRGYATALVQSAITTAKRHGGVLVTVGGPVGYILFSGLGFHDLGAVKLPSSLDTNIQSVKAMSLVVEKLERRRSFVDSLIDYISN